MVVACVVLVVIAATARTPFATRVVHLLLHGPGGTHAVTSAGGKVTVTANDKWRIHRGFRWTLVCGRATLDAFVFNGETASVSGAVGSCELEGSVCSGPPTRSECVPFKESVEVD